MSADPVSLPIFPLGTVLFPGGKLPLRVFEARYVDMVRAAMRDGSEFGVCLLKSGHEVGKRDVDLEDIGCRARIDDWDMEQLGVLQIVTTGTQRFRIVSRSARPDGLITADVVPIEAEPEVPVPPDASPCRSLLQRIVERFNAATDTEPSDDESSDDDSSDEDRQPAPIAKPYRFDDATWVGNRLCELLPIPLPAKQKLMALTDGPTRLEIVQQFLKQHRIV